MIRPPSRRRLAASRSVLNVPFRLTLIWRSKWASSASAIDESMHDAGIVDQHVDAAEGRFGGVEHAAHGVRIADVGLARVSAWPPAFSIFWASSSAGAALPE